jgi:hypothetical protein
MDMASSMFPDRKVVEVHAVDLVRAHDPLPDARVAGCLKEWDLGGDIFQYLDPSPPKVTDALRSNNCLPVPRIELTPREIPNMIVLPCAQFLARRSPIAELIPEDISSTKQYI